MNVFDLYVIELAVDFWIESFCANMQSVTEIEVNGRRK